MKCPHCGSNSDTEVKDSRPYENWTRRRRKCLNCAKQYTTYERIGKEDREGSAIKPESVVRLRSLALEILTLTGDATVTQPNSSR
jgi:transcriptional repressor NrdR